MTAVIKNELGTITMNEELIASIAGFAAGENYGIVAMNSGLCIASARRWRKC